MTTWVALFPKTSTGAQRRANWSAFQSQDEETAALWISDGCDDCQHDDHGWCLLENLPTGFNPVLTPCTGILGMACMGAGRADQNSSLNPPLVTTGKRL